MLNHQRDNQQRIPPNSESFAGQKHHLGGSVNIGKQVITINQQGICSTLGQYNSRTQIERMKGGI